MKHSVSLTLASALFLTGCERSETSDRSPRESEAVIAALDEARLAAQAEREQLEAEREMLAAEREALEAARYVDEDSLQLSEGNPVDSVPVAVTVDEDDSAAGRAELEAWESELTERETALAGEKALVEDLAPEPESYQEPVADYGLFYDSLEDHGDWFETPDYGYIFQPQVVIQDNSWRPYTRGRWVCSDRGWLWVSEEPFGWATYHYGRWVLLAGRGWCWVPGGEWAPAWVAWRHGGGHVGWAPLPPETLSVRGRNWGVTVEADFGIGDAWFNFVEERYIASPIWRHCLPTRNNHRFFANARSCTNLYYSHGSPMSCGPSYAALRRHVPGAWPVRRIEIDPIGGIRHPGMRLPHQRDRNVRVFAPALNAAWNPAIRPSRVARTLQDIRVDRAPGGISSEWQQRFQERRREQQSAQQQWASKVREVREEQLNKNRLAAVETRNRILQRRQAQLPANLNDGRKPRPGLRPQVDSPIGGNRTKPMAPGDLGRRDPAKPSATSGQSGAKETFQDRLQQQREKRQEAQNAARERREAAQQQAGGTRPGAEATGRVREAQKLAEARKAELQERTARLRQEQGNDQRSAAERREALKAANQEKLRQQQERASQMKERQVDQRQALREAQQSKAENVQQAAQERAREQQERAQQMRQQAEQKKLEAQQAAQDRAREQQERAQQMRQQAEQKKLEAQQAAQERAREQQERAQQMRQQAELKQQEAQRIAQERAQRAAQERAQQEQARQAAQERARQQQEQARQAAQDRMRQQQEQARQQQEQARQAAQERARQQQDQAQQRQQEQQERMRQQQERMRELREQQQQNRNR